MTKGPVRTRAETTHVKMPQAGPKRPVTVMCDSGKSRKFIEKTTHQVEHRFRDNSTHCLRQFTNSILLDFELKIIKVSVN